MVIYFNKYLKFATSVILLLGVVRTYLDYNMFVP